MDSSPSFEGTVDLSIMVEDTAKAPLGNVALFIYDIDSLYELVRIAIDAEYSAYSFSRFALFRNGRPIREEDRLHVKSISLGSPLEIAAAIQVYASSAAAVFGALWLLVQLIDKLSNARLNRNKLRLDVEKLRRDLLHGPSEPASKASTDPTKMLDDRGAQEYVHQVLRRLEKSTMTIVGYRFKVNGEDQR